MFKAEEMKNAKVYTYNFWHDIQQKIKSNFEKLNLPVKEVIHINMTNWRNPIDGDTKIYTKEYINSMLKEELEKEKNKILYQAKHLGIPREKDMQISQKIYGNLIHVRAYVRKSGVHVRDYWRSIAQLTK